MPDRDYFPPTPPPHRNVDVPDVIVPPPSNSDFTQEKMPEHCIMGKAVQQVAAAATEMETRRGSSVWLYVIATLLVLFMLAMFLLAAVASKP